MAHPCYFCGGECHCSHDWDDVIVSKTPKNCESCGCDDDSWDDYDDDTPEGYWDEEPCFACGHSNGHMKGCPEDNSPFAELCRNGYD